MQEAIMKIEGMSCQHCVMAVNKALKTLQGIGDAEVDIGTAKVHYDETQVKKEDLVAAIERAGYKVK
jgi:copper chaperone